MDTILKNLFRKIQCFVGSELQKQNPEKFLPQTVYFLKVTHIAIDVLLNMVYLKDQYFDQFSVICLSDMFLLIDEIDIASYAEGDTPYTMGHTAYVMNRLETACKKFFKWYGLGTME